jgi:hypothetical protein
MRIAVAGNLASAGIAIADINLKLIWDVVAAIRIGDTGHVLVVDDTGRLVAHPDISRVLRGGAGSGDFNRLRSVVDAANGAAVVATGDDGKPVVALSVRAAANEVDPSRGLAGYVTTYQAVAAAPDLHLAEFQRHRTLLVVDELHHLPALYDLNPNKVGLVDNYVTPASNYGNMYQHWNGIDVGVNVRVQQGLMLQGGVSSGKTFTDKCEVQAKLPELQVGYEALSLNRDAVSIGVTNNAFCRNETPFLTQLKLLGAYSIPRIGIQFAATYQDVPGPEILANYTVSNALVQPSLGRPLSGGAANVTVPLLAPGELYGPRERMLDLRLARTFKYGRTRTTINLDIYNSLNANAVTFLNQNYGATGVGWQAPTAIIDARLFKISAQFEF